MPKPTKPKPFQASSAPMVRHDYSSIGAGEPNITNLVPMTLDSGIEVYVTPVPLYRMHNGIPTHIPMSAREQTAYGKPRNLMHLTDKVFDAMAALGRVKDGTQGKYIYPQTGFYDTNGDMQSPALVIEKARRVKIACDKVGAGPNTIVANASKAFIISNANRDKPTSAVNRGYWQTPTDTIPVQKYGTAHTWDYTDIAQCAFYMSTDTSEGDARGILTGPKFKLLTNESEPLWRLWYE